MCFFSDTCLAGKGPSMFPTAQAKNGGFPGGAVVKNSPASAADAGDLGWIPVSRSSPGEGNGNPLQYSCLENPMDRGTWWATAHGITEKLDTAK